MTFFFNYTLTLFSPLSLCQAEFPDVEIGKIIKAKSTTATWREVAFIFYQK